MNDLQKLAFDQLPEPDLQLEYQEIQEAELRETLNREAACRQKWLEIFDNDEQDMY